MQGFVEDTYAERASKEQRFAALLADKRRRKEEEGRRAEEESQEDGLQEERKPLEASLANYLRFVWSILYPSKPLAWSWHYELLAEYMQLVYERKILYFICNIPPRTLKSIMISVGFPTWVWAKDPLPAFLGASSDVDLATGFNTKRRKVIESAQYQRLFGHRVRLARGENRQNDFANTAGGEMKVASPESNIIGRGGDFLLMDDVLSPKNVDSPLVAQGVFDWVDETFLQRRNDISRSPFMLVEQRVGEGDMTHHLLKSLPKGDDFVHLVIPLVAEERTEYVFPISGRVHVRERGDVLMPAIFTPKVIAALKLRSRVYNTQFQQRPTSKVGKTFKREWFKFYGPKSQGYDVQLPEKFDEVCQSWDCTFKKKEDSDMVAGHVWARKGANKFLLDRHTERMSFTETLKAILAMRNKHPYAKRIYIEDKANGSAVIDTLNQKIGGIVAVEPMGSKEARADASSADAESGNIYLPGPLVAPWVDEFLDYMCAFPGPLNDDDVDAYSQAILKMSKGKDGLFDYYTRLMTAEEEPTRSVFDMASGQ